MSVAPVYLDFFDEGGSDELVVTFEDCLFTNNRFLGYGSNTALVYANSAQNRLALERTVFTNNNMIFNNTQVSPSCVRLFSFEVELKRVGSFLEVA